MQVFIIQFYHCVVLTLSSSEKLQTKYWPGNQAASAFTVIRAFLPSASYSAGGSGWVWQPSADCKGFGALYF
jgi:hypothetical protein